MDGWMDGWIDRYINIFIYIFFFLFLPYAPRKCVFGAGPVSAGHHLLESKFVVSGVELPTSC